MPPFASATRPSRSVTTDAVPQRNYGSLGLLILAGLLVAGQTAGAAEVRARTVGFQPEAYAVAGARLVIEPGRTIESGTLVIREGRITAVGENVEPPDDAEVIEAEGLVVYPGFIDAGAAAPLDRSAKPTPVAGRPVNFERYVLAGTRPDNRKGLTPEFRAATGVNVADDRFESLRKQGFTSLHAVPTGRIASGQACLVSTASTPPRESLVAERTFSHLRLYAPGGDGYPKTLMGSTAHLRQAFLDAERYAKHWKLFRADSDGLDPPPVDPALEALHAVRAGEQRALFTANTRDDIHRALDFAAEQGLSITLWGGREAHKVIDRLKQKSVDVIVRIDFGEKPKVEPPQDSDELKTDLKDPLRAQKDRLRRWKERVGGPAAFHEAGLRFAVSSRDLKKPQQVFENLRRAIDEGLPREAALAALTSSAAEIAGLGNRLGTLAPGKLGHAVVMTGPFDHKKSKVRYVFVDGELFEYNEDAEPVIPEDPEDTKPAVAEIPGSNDKAVQLGTPDAADDDSPAAEDPEPAVAEIPADGLPTELEKDRLARPIQTGGNVFIRGGTVLTGTGKTLPETSIRVRNGKIQAIGADLEPGENETVIDAGGRYVMPGIIDTHSHIMIDGGVNEYSQSIVPEVRIKDVVETDDRAEYRALAGGVTAARLLHGSANVIGGQDAVVKMKYGATAGEHILDDAPQGVKFALGENVKYRRNRFPNTRLGIEATLKRAFNEAADYRQRIKENVETAQRSSASRKSRASAPLRRDLRLEALADILGREKFIHCHCYRADGILMLLRIAENRDIRVWSLQHVLEGYKVAQEIASHGASCSTFADWWAYKMEAYDATPYNAALLNEAGANAVLKSDNAELMRHMYHEASKPVRYGNVDPQDALQMVTLNAARELGLDERMGSIEVGKDADLAVFNGHPLSTFARCEMTLIDGEVYFSRKHAPTAMSPEAEDRSADAPPFQLPPPGIRNKEVDLAESPSGRYALVGAMLHPVEEAPIRDGILLVDNGEIAEIGRDLPIPEDAKRLDLTGFHVYPGLIDAGTRLGLTEIGKVRETHDYAESGRFQPDVRAGVGINRDSALIPAARAGGITTAFVRPTGGIIAGQASLAKLDGWTTPEMVFELEAGLQVDWPNNDKQANALREFFERARQYDRIRTKTEKNGKRGPVIDPRLEAMRPYLHGEKPVFIEAHAREEIAEALLFAEKQELDIVITGGTDAWKLADELKERDVPVVVGPVMRRPVEDYDPFDAPYANPGRLHEAGVRFCIRSDSASNSRNAPFEAGMAVAYGLPREAALRAVTLSAAEILGIEEHVGSLAGGKRADVIITDGTPLRHATQIKGVFINGRPHPPTSKQTRLYHRYRQRLETKPDRDARVTADGEE